MKNVIKLGLAASLLCGTVAARAYDPPGYQEDLEAPVLPNLTLGALLDRLESTLPCQRFEILRGIPTEHYKKLAKAAPLVFRKLCQKDRLAWLADFWPDRELKALGPEVFIEIVKLLPEASRLGQLRRFNWNGVDGAMVLKAARVLSDEDDRFRFIVGSEESPGVSLHGFSFSQFEDLVVSLGFSTNRHPKGRCPARLHKLLDLLGGGTLVRWGDNVPHVLTILPMSCRGFLAAREVRARADLGDKPVAVRDLRLSDAATPEVPAP